MIFLVLATVGFWNGFTCKETSDIQSIMNKISIYDAFSSIMYAINIGAIFMLSTFHFLSLILSYHDILSLASSFAVSQFLLGLAVSTSIIFMKIYKSRRKVFMRLGKVGTDDTPYEGLFSPVGSYAVGGALVLFGFVALLGGGAIMDYCIDFFSDMIIGLGKFGSTITRNLPYDTVFDSMEKGIALTGLINLVQGSYLIVSAIWMKSVHAEEIGYAKDTASN